MRKTGTVLVAAALGAAAVALAACGVEGEKQVVEVVKPVVPPAKDPLPGGLMLAASPGDAADVSSIKATAREGDTVIVRGRIGGGVEPFVSGVSAMTIADRKLVPCSEMKMEDGCKTPWDYCCASPDELTRGIATIQVVGADGQPLRTDLRTAGLTELSTVVVKGKVGARPDPKVLVVAAEGIFVETK